MISSRTHLGGVRTTNKKTNLRTYGPKTGGQFFCFLACRVNNNQENQLTDLRTSSRDTIFCTGKWRCDYDRSIDVMPTAEDGSMETTHNEDGGKKTGLWSRWLLVNALLENLIMMGAPQLFIYLCCAIWTTCLFGRLCYATAGYIIIKMYTIVSVFN